MKHLKLFENNNNHMWCVIHIEREDPYNNHSIFTFDDEESARNYFIVYMNDLKKQVDDDKELILTVEDAERWLEEENDDNDYVECRPINYEGKFELPQDLKDALQAKKYNL